MSPNPDLPPPSNPPWALAIESLPAAGDVEQLVVLLHGWGADGASMQPLADALRAEFPQAALLAPDAPQATDGGRRGRMWYSIEGLPDDALWAARVQSCLPELQHWVLAQQRRLDVRPAACCLAGFSQGAILSLALASRRDGLAGRVLAFGGCYVTPPQVAPRLTTLHFFHGSDDRVIPAEGSRRALEQLGALQGDATIDIAHGIGHELHPALIDRALFRLRHHIPMRTWQAALGAVAADGAGAAGDT